MVDARAVVCPAATLNVAASFCPNNCVCPTRACKRISLWLWMDVCFILSCSVVMSCFNPAPQQQIVASLGSSAGPDSAPPSMSSVCGLAWGPVVSSFVGLKPACLVVPRCCILTFFCELLGSRLCRRPGVFQWWCCLFVAWRSLGAANFQAQNSFGPCACVRSTLQGTLVQGCFTAVWQRQSFQQLPKAQT